MTEAEWLACQKCYAMLVFLREQGSVRKFRLLACACCRQVWHLLPYEGSREALQVSERYIDGKATSAERDAAERAAFTVFDDLGRIAFMSDEFEAAHAVHLAIQSCRESDSGGVARRLAVAAVGHAADALCTVEQDIDSDQCLTLRDIFANPFRPTTIPPGWLTWGESTVPKLAQCIYDERDFDRMPILGDALEEAGCADDAILAHCRGPGPHVRGCWVVDLILGRS